LMMDGELEDISMSPRVTEVARGEARRDGNFHAGKMITVFDYA
jgi:hypothetical protein